MARAALELNRYPDGGSYRLRQALAERHGVRFEEVTVCAGADAVIGYTSPVDARPGRRGRSPAGRRSRATCSTRSSSARVPVRVPLRDHRFDLDALLDAITPRTKLVFVAAPNNPTGHDERPRRARRVLRRASRRTSSPSSTRRTSSTSTSPTTRTRSRSTSRPGTACSSCARSRRSTGSPGFASATASGPTDVITAIGKVRRAFDVSSAGQEAALASLGDDELARRRARTARR